MNNVVWSEYAEDRNHGELQTVIYASGTKHAYAGVVAADLLPGARYVCWQDMPYSPEEELQERAEILVNVAYARRKL